MRSTELQYRRRWWSWISTLGQECCSPGLSTGASTATVLHSVLYHPGPETFSYSVTSLSSQGRRECRSPVTLCTRCTHQEMWLSRSPFACEGMFNVFSSSQENTVTTGFQRYPHHYPSLLKAGRCSVENLAVLRW